MQGHIWPKMMEEIEYFGEMVPDVSTNDIDQQSQLLDIGVEMSRRSISRNRGELRNDLKQR